MLIVDICGDHGEIIELKYKHVRIFKLNLWWYPGYVTVDLHIDHGESTELKI